MRDRSALNNAASDRDRERERGSHFDALVTPVTVHYWSRDTNFKTPNPTASSHSWELACGHKMFPFIQPDVGLPSSEETRR